MITSIGPIDPLEVKLITFDFARELESPNTIADATLECTAASGSDADAPARLIGLPVLTAGSVTQRVGGCIAGVVYVLRCRVSDSAGLAHVLSAVLPCTRL